MSKEQQPMTAEHQNKLMPEENKFHKGNGQDGKHYWLTPPELMQTLQLRFNFDFDACPFPKPDDFDGLSIEWGQSSYVNPPFGSVMHQGPSDKKPKKKGMTAWVRKSIEEHKKGKKVVIVFPIDKWLLMLVAAGAKIENLGDVKWVATEDGTAGKGTGRHIAQFTLEDNYEGMPESNQKSLLHCQQCADKDKQIEALNEVLEDKRRLTKEIDVIINGKDAAKSPSLGDVLKSVQDIVNKLQEVNKEIDRLKTKSSKCSCCNCPDCSGASLIG